MRRKKKNILISGSSLAAYTLIPDANFEQALIDLGYDTAPIDGKVLTANIENVTELQVINKGISDLTGIEDFTALERLTCNTNQITSLNVSQNTALQNLHCPANQLTSLDVSSNTALEVLSCQNNPLISLNLGSNTVLFDLDCHSNQLTSLDVSQNTALLELLCANCPLTSAAINQIIIDIENHGLSNGTLGIPIGRTSASDAAWAALQSRNYFLLES
jgi:hypothetical protein